MLEGFSSFVLQLILSFYSQYVTEVHEMISFDSQMCTLHNVLLVKLNTVNPEYFFSNHLQCMDYDCMFYLPACPMNKN